MIKMLVTDIDGTIVGKNLKVSEKVKKTFQKLIQNNIKVVLATGRMYLATEPIAKECGLVDPIICYQGGYIKEVSEEKNVLRQILVEKDVATRIVNEIKKHNIHINLYANDTLYVEKDNDIIKKYCSDRFIPYEVVDDFSTLNFDGYHKILAIDNEAEKITFLIKDLQEKFSKELYITGSTPYFCEVSNLQANKGSAIEFLAKKWNIKKQEIMACGDQNNDIELLNSAGIKIAVGNASEKLKTVADFVAPDVENDGICCAIEKYINI